MAITTNGGAGVTADAVATLSNKTLAAPVITGGVGITGTTTIAGDLTVTGTTTNINTTNLVVEDKNIVINDVVSPSDVNADGGGISLSGTTTKTLNWVDATDAWTSSEHLNLASGKSYYANGTLLKDVSETLTNKTLTNPVINNFILGYSTTATAAGTTTLTNLSNNQQLFTGTTTQTVVMPVATTMVVGTRFVIENNSTGIVTVQSSGANVIVAIPSGMSIKITSILSSGTTAASWDFEYVGFGAISGTGSVVLTTGAALNTPVMTRGILVAPQERTTISAIAAATTVNFDAATQGVLYYTSSATANWAFNVRGDSGTTLNSMLATGDSITVVFLVTNGATAYYASSMTIDGSAVTPKFITGTAFTAGNASSIDSYVYTIFKTGSAAFTVLASQTKFA